MTIKAIIFDFDGLILDTETPEWDAWELTYKKYGFKFPSEYYLGTIGAVSDNSAMKGKLLDAGLEPALLEEALEFYEKTAFASDLLKAPRPGVTDFFEQAKQMQLKVGIASSSYRRWVVGNLKRLELVHHFDPICTRDLVERSKPAPDLYLLVLEAWQIAPEEAVVFEDSPNGITAAKAAGIPCVAVPNPVTKKLDTSHADLNIASFADHSLQEILNKLWKF